MIEDMEPTQIKQGTEGPLPAPAGSAQLDLYQRAPTLMAGETTGSGGEVRVWGPRQPTRSIGSIAVRVLEIAGMVAAFIVGMTSLLAFFLNGIAFLLSLIAFILHGSSPFWLCLLRLLESVAGMGTAVTILMVSVLFSAERVRRKAAALKPNYISSDGAGICFTIGQEIRDGMTLAGSKGSIALQWCEVGGATLLGPGLQIYTLSGKTLDIGLTNYTREDRQELYSTLWNKAELIKTKPLRPSGTEIKSYLQKTVAAQKNDLCDPPELSVIWVFTQSVLWALTRVMTWALTRFVTWLFTGMFCVLFLMTRYDARPGFQLPPLLGLQDPLPDCPTPALQNAQSKGGENE